MQWAIENPGRDLVSPRTLTDHPEEPPDSRAVALANRMKSRERMKRMETLLNDATPTSNALDHDSYDEDRWDDGEEPAQAAAKLEPEAADSDFEDDDLRVRVHPIDGRLEDCQQSKKTLEAQLERSQEEHIRGQRVIRSYKIRSQRLKKQLEQQKSSMLDTVSSGLQSIFDALRGYNGKFLMLNRIEFDDTAPRHITESISEEDDSDDDATSEDDTGLVRQRL